MFFQSYNILGKTGPSEEGVEEFRDEPVTHEDETGAQVSGLSQQSDCVDADQLVHQC